MWTPPAAVVSIVAPTDLSDVRGSFCDEVHFFASAEAASSWMHAHPGGTVISVSDGFELGRRLTRSMLAAETPPTGDLAGHPWMERGATEREEGRC